jgi:hypothetical protein
MLVSRLQGNNDLAIEQATDELYSHHLLAGYYDVSYEEDENSPDFRLYRSDEYVAGIEVLSLFSDEYFTSLQSRNAAFVEEINHRVPADRWYLGMDIVDWKRQPRVADVARWLEQTIADLLLLARASLARTSRQRCIQTVALRLHSTSFLAGRPPLLAGPQLSG